MRVLFVDDEPNILGGLRRILRPMRNEWDMEFAEGGAAALDCMKAEPFDVVVSDMKMPRMDGAALLSEVKELYPKSIRIALSGETDSHMIYRCVQHAHQYIAKPCDAALLTATVKRACALRELMVDENLKSVVAKLSSLPSLPGNYSSIMEELQSEEPSLQKVAEIIEADVGMTAKILQLVNSAFFGLARHLSSPAEAAMFLGFDVIKSLVLKTGVFSQFDKSTVGAAILTTIENHSTQVGSLAKKIANQQTGKEIISDYALMGGLLIDVGKLVFAANFSDEFLQIEKTAADNDRPDWIVEREVLGHSHMDVGAYLMGLWGLPNPVVECVAYHHVPADCVEAEFSALSAVHIADAIVTANGSNELTVLDTAYIDGLGVADKIPEWTTLHNELNAAA